MNKTSIVFIGSIAIALSFVMIWRSNKQAQRTVPLDVLLVGTNAEYQPYSFIKNNTIVGLDIDIAREVAKRLGKSMELIDMPFDMLLPQLQLGDIHLIAAGISPTPERAKKVLFTQPYFEGDPLLIVSLRSTPPITNLDDLNGKEVIVNDGFTADAYMSARQGPIVKRLATPAEALLALKSGRAYAYVTAQSSLHALPDTSAYAMVPIEGTYDSYALAISPRYKELLPEVQQALDAMTADGTIATIKQKWGLVA